jgi:signal transduction histidine kinase
MFSESMKRWLASDFSRSWQLMVLVFISYVVNGQLFAGVSLVDGGPPSIVFDSYNAFSVIAVLFIFRFMPIKRKLLRAILGWVVASATSNFLPVLLLPILYSTVDANSQNYKDFALIASLGFFQMILMQSLLTILLASFSESRAASRELAFERAQLNHLKSNFENQIVEIQQRLENDVKSKLRRLIDALLSDMNRSSSTSELANFVGDALNNGVRPLSWQIHTDGDTASEVKKVKPIKASLRERFAFRVSPGEATLVWLAALVMVIYDIPLIFFVFGADAIFQGLVSIAFTTLALFGVTYWFSKWKIFGWLAVALITVLAGLGGISFVIIRALSGQLTSDASEYGVVISFMQIFFAVTLFKVGVLRRADALRRAADFNSQLQLLVSTLRQNAWVQKQKLARIIHGPVQSSLFSVYLRLSQAQALNENELRAISEEVSSATNAIEAAGDFERMPFMQAVDQLKSGWGHGLHFEVNVSQALAIALDGSVATKACVLEALREAINNAAKYGTGTVKVTVDFDGQDLVRIEVINDVDKINGENKAGFGSTVLDEITHTWRLEKKNDQAIFSALVAFAN